MQDHACTEEADAGNDTLDDPAYVRLRIVGDREHGERRSQADEPEGSHARRL